MKAEVEPILFTDGNLLNSRRVDLPAFDHPLHRHPEMEVLWIERSTGYRMIGDAVGEFRPGDLYVLGGGLPHLFSHRTPPEGGAAAEVLQFPCELLDEPLFQSPELHALRGLFHQARGGLCFQGDCAESAGTCLQELRLATGPERWSRFFRLWEVILSVEVPDPLAGPGGTLTGAPLHSDRMQRVCSHLLTHFHEPVSLEEMARMAHYTPAAFSRRFKQATRKTFTRFLTELRLGHARTLLRETDWTVLRISLESGFQNLSNFNRRFLEANGCSPRAYRKKLFRSPCGDRPRLGCPSILRSDGAICRP